MKDFNMPIFKIKKTEKYLVVAGGGGNKSYGMENGITVIGPESEEFFYKTNDVIIKLAVYDLMKSNNTVEDEKITKSEETTIEEQGSKSETIEEVELPIKYTESDILIAASDKSTLYVLKFNGIEFKNLLEINEEVSKFILTTDLVILYRAGYIHGYYDLVNADGLKEPDLNKSIVDKTHWRFNIRSNKDNNLLFYNNEDDATSSVVPVGCMDFYVKNNELFVIRYNETEEETYIPMNDENLEIQGKVESVLVNQKFFLYYQNSQRLSNIFVNGESFKFTKITDVAFNDEVVAASSVTGDILIYSNKSKRVISVSTIPITGIDIKNDKLYYSLLSGSVGETPINRKIGYKFIIFFIFMIFLAILWRYYLMRNFNK